MAASSSATRMLPSGMSVVPGIGGGARIRGHQDAQRRLTGLRFTFDDTAVVADDLGHKGKAEPGAIRLGGDERFEQMRHQFLGHAAAVVANTKFERQCYLG